MIADILDAYGASDVIGHRAHFGISDGVNIQNVTNELLASEAETRVYWATGIGKSALVAQKFVGTLRSLGRSASFIHPVDGLHGDVGAWNRGDVLLAISASGKTSEVMDIARTAITRGLAVVSLTTVKPNPLALIAQRNLYSVDPGQDPFHIPSASFSTACAVADALAVGLAGHGHMDHPGGEIGRQLS